MHNKILSANKQNLVKSNFPFINTFNHTGTAVVHAVRKIKVGVFEHLETTSTMDVYQRDAYT